MGSSNTGMTGSHWFTMEWISTFHWIYLASTCCPCLYQWLRPLWNSCCFCGFDGQTLLQVVTTWLLILRSHVNYYGCIYFYDFFFFAAALSRHGKLNQGFGLYSSSSTNWRKVSIVLDLLIHSITSYVNFADFDGDTDDWSLQYS